MNKPTEASTGKMWEGITYTLMLLGWGMMGSESVEMERPRHGRPRRGDSACGQPCRVRQPDLCCSMKHAFKEQRPDERLMSHSREEMFLIMEVGGGTKPRNGSRCSRID